MQKARLFRPLKAPLRRGFFMRASAIIGAESRGGSAMHHATLEHIRIADRYRQALMSPIPGAAA
jgi:hypothetical protein